MTTRTIGFAVPTSQPRANRVSATAKATTAARNEMAPLTERQLTAQSIAAELHKLGAAVICLLPLSPGQNLRFQVLDTDREAILERVSLWGWSPTLCNSVPRFTPQGPQPASVYEIQIPADRQPVPQDRSVPRSEIA